MAQQIHDASQNLSYELQQFRSGWSYFPQLAQLELVIGDFPQELKRLSSELRQSRYGRATGVEGDRQWMDRFDKLQEASHGATCAGAVAGIVSGCERLKARCEKLLDANKPWPVEFQNSLRTSIDGLRNFVEANGLKSRIETLEKTTGMGTQDGCGRRSRGSIGRIGNGTGRGALGEEFFGRLRVPARPVAVVN